MVIIKDCNQIGKTYRKPKNIFLTVNKLPHKSVE